MVYFDLITVIFKMYLQNSIWSLFTLNQKHFRSYWNGFCQFHLVYIQQYSPLASLVITMVFRTELSQRRIGNFLLDIMTSGYSFLGSLVSVSSLMHLGRLNWGSTETLVDYLSAL